MGSSVKEESFLRVGDVVGGKYRIVRRIGQGGMGSVYEAENISLGRTLALKFLEPHLAKSPHLVERFMREARAAATLTHPNVVYVFDVGWLEDGKLPYMAMELLGGQALSTAVQGGGLSFERAVGIVLQILDALDAAHAKGIVHRDLKPANVFLLKGDVVKVLDFGISKMMGAGDNKLTATGSVLGTPSYMSPEQARGAKTTDHRTDLYGVGAILYEMLSGVAPYEGDSYNEILFKIATESPLPITAIRPDAPLGLVAFLDRAMRRNPDERFSSARQMREALLELTTAASGTGLALADGRKSGPPAVPAPTPAPTPAAWEITHPSDVIEGAIPVAVAETGWIGTGAPGTTDPHSLARTAPSAPPPVTAPRLAVPRPVLAGGISAAVVLALLGAVAWWSSADDPAPVSVAPLAPPAGPSWSPPPRAPVASPPPALPAPVAPACRFRVTVATSPATVTLGGTATTREVDQVAPCGARSRLVVEAPGFHPFDREIVAGPRVEEALRVELTRVVASGSPGRRDNPREPAQSPSRRSDAPPASGVQILEPNPFSH